MSEHRSETSTSQPLFERDTEYEATFGPILRGIIQRTEPCSEPLPCGLDPERWLRIVMHYVARTRSSRLSVAWATLIGLVDHLSHSWLLHGLEASARWLQALAQTAFEDLLREVPMTPFFRGHQVVVVDGTRVGGECLHLMFELASGWLRQFRLDLDQTQGESLCHFALSPGMLVLADRLYCSATSAMHALSQQAHLLVRWRRNCALYLSEQGKDCLDWREALEGLALGQTLERAVWLQNAAGQRVAVRVIATNLGETFAQTQLEQAQRNKQPITAELQRYAGYLVLVTTVPADELSAMQACELYHQRWSGAEIAIREFKSVLGLKHVIGSRPQKRRAWLYTQLLVRGVIQRFDAPTLSQGVTLELELSPSAGSDSGAAGAVEAASPRGQGTVRVSLAHEQKYFRWGLLKEMLTDTLMPLRASWWPQLAPRLMALLPRPRRRKRPRSLNALLRKLLPDTEYERWQAAAA